VARAFPDALRMLPPPLPVPGFDVHMVWHPRMDRDPAHAWLRAQVTDSVADA
jgi:DNA-binding transcriptional LysR family regulator